MKTFVVTLFLSFVWFSIPMQSLAQSVADTSVEVKPYRNSVYAELGGNGLVGSVNYERLSYTPYRPNSTISTRLGLFFLPSRGIRGNRGSSLMIPAEISIFWGKRAVKPEIGFGFTYIQSAYSGDRYFDEEGYFEINLLPFFRFGLRHEKPDKPFFWRLGFTPTIILEAYEPPQMLPWGGLCVGYKFGRK